MRWLIPMSTYNRKKISIVLWIILLGIALLWGCKGTGVDLVSVLQGLNNTGSFMRSMFPPNFKILPKLVSPIMETLQMAIVSILLSTCIALPLAFLAARNTTPSVHIYRIIRMLLNLLRSIPTLLYALLFIAMVGLGAFPGVIGLTLHCTGTLGKYFSEGIENVNPGVVEAARATGATKLQVIVYAIIPELSSQFLGFVLYYFEYCIRTASMMGVVGAGGIGMILLNHIRLFRYPEMLAVLIIIVGMVTSVDIGSFLIRRKIIGVKT